MPGAAGRSCAKRRSGDASQGWAGAAGTSIGAQLVRPDIRQSSSFDSLPRSRTSTTPAIAKDSTRAKPISAAVRRSSLSRSFWYRLRIGPLQRPARLDHRIDGTATDEDLASPASALPFCLSDPPVWESLHQNAVPDNAPAGQDPFAGNEWGLQLVRPARPASCARRLGPTRAAPPRRSTARAAARPRAGRARRPR